MMTEDEITETKESLESLLVSFGYDRQRTRAFLASRTKPEPVGINDAESKADQPLPARTALTAEDAMEALKQHPHTLQAVWEGCVFRFDAYGGFQEFCLDGEWHPTTPGKGACLMSRKAGYTIRPAAKEKPMPLPHRIAHATGPHICADCGCNLGNSTAILSLPCPVRNAEQPTVERPERNAFQGNVDFFAKLKDEVEHAELPELPEALSKHIAERSGAEKWSEPQYRWHREHDALLLTEMRKIAGSTVAMHSIRDEDRIRQIFHEEMSRVADKAVPAEHIVDAPHVAEVLAAGGSISGLTAAEAENALRVTPGKLEAVSRDGTLILRAKSVPQIVIEARDHADRCSPWVLTVAVGEYGPFTLRPVAKEEPQPSNQGKPSRIFTTASPDHFSQQSRNFGKMAAMRDLGGEWEAPKPERLPHVFTDADMKSTTGRIKCQRCGKPCVPQERFEPCPARNQATAKEEPQPESLAHEPKGLRHRPDIPQTPWTCAHCGLFMKNEDVGAPCPARNVSTESTFPPEMSKKAENVKVSYPLPCADGSTWPPSDEPRDLPELPLLEDLPEAIQRACIDAGDSVHDEKFFIDLLHLSNALLVEVDRRIAAAFERAVIERDASVPPEKDPLWTTHGVKLRVRLEGK